MAPLAWATIVLVAFAVLGVAAAAVFALARRGRPGGLAPRVAAQRAGSYAALAIALLIAAWLGVPGIAVLFAVVGSLALVEWSRMFELPAHHRVAVVVANVVIMAAVAVAGPKASDWLVAGLVLVGVLWPVVRADTGRAIRDLGFAAVGVAIISVLLAHGIALGVAWGEAGLALVVALAVGCAFADVGAFIVGRRFGRHPLAALLSPAKTREGLVGSLLGACGVLLFAPAIVPTFGGWLTIALVFVVALGSVWGDLLESAAKREAGVKDAGAWLPGFGGMLDRIDSLLPTLALAYWLARIGSLV